MHKASGYARLLDTQGFWVDEAGYVTVFFVLLNFREAPFSQRCPLAAGEPGGAAIVVGRTDMVITIAARGFGGGADLWARIQAIGVCRCTACSTSADAPEQGLSK